MVTCGVCGETANPGSIFCRRCGAELPRRGLPISDAQTTVLPVVPAAADDPAPDHGGVQPRHEAPVGTPGPSNAAGPSEQSATDRPLTELFDEPYDQTTDRSSEQHAGQPAAEEFTRTAQLPPVAGPAAHTQQPQYQQPQYQPPQPQHQQPQYQQPQYHPPQPQYQPPQPQSPPRPAYLGGEAGQAEPPEYQPAPVFLPPDNRSPRPPGHRNRTIAAIIGGVLVLVLIAFGIAIALLSKDSSKNGVAQPAPSTSASNSKSGPPSTPPATSATPTPTPTPSNVKLTATQTVAMKQLGGLVSQSGSVRSGIQTALNQIGSCTSINQAITSLTSASNTRRSLAGKAGKLDLNSLPNHAQLLQTFQTSMTESALADQQYANWGRQVRPSCRKKARSTSALTAAQVHDGRATAAKNAFAQQWNADAKNLGLAGVDNGSL